MMMTGERTDTAYVGPTIRWTTQPGHLQFLIRSLPSNEGYEYSS